MKIKKVNYASSCFGGCETCDYGSEYISNIEIILEDGNVLNIDTTQMYDYMLSEQDYMVSIANSNSIDELIVSLLDIIKNKSYDIESRIGLADMIMKINDKKVDMVETLKQNKIVYAA